MTWTIGADDPVLHNSDLGPAWTLSRPFHRKPPP